MSIKIKVSDVLAADPVIGRWSNLQVPAAMSMTLGMVIRAVRPILEEFTQKQVRLGEQFREFVSGVSEEETKDPSILKSRQAVIVAKRKELEAQLQELLDNEVEIGIGTIKLSRITKARIVPTGEELARVWWLVEGDMDGDSELAVIEEAKPLKKIIQNNPVPSQG